MATHSPAPVSTSSVSPSSRPPRCHAPTKTAQVFPSRADEPEWGHTRPLEKGVHSQRRGKNLGKIRHPVAGSKAETVPLMLCCAVLCCWSHRKPSHHRKLLVVFEEVVSGCLVLKLRRSATRWRWHCRPHCVGTHPWGGFETAALITRRPGQASAGSTLPPPGRPFISHASWAAPSVISISYRLCPSCLLTKDMSLNVFG